MESVVVLAQEAHTELPVHPFLIGLIAFVILLALLGVTLAIGRGRPHS
jgi:hypothetical protein